MRRSFPLLVSRVGGSLSRRLALLFALVLLPPTAVSLYLAWDAFHEHTERAKLSVRQLTALAATYERKFFEDTRERLQRLANEPGVSMPSGGDCNAVLQRALENAPELAGLTFRDPDGSPICSTSGTKGSAAQQAWFEEALRYRNFTISDYTFTPDSRQPVIVAAIPVFGSSGSIQGVLNASIELYWLSSFSREARLPKDAVFFLLDSNGQVLANSNSLVNDADGALPKQREARSATSPPTERTRLTSIMQQDLVKEVVARRLVDFQAIGNDGVRRVYSSVALPHGNVIVLFGVPAHTMLGWIKQDLVARVSSLAAIWLMGIGAAWIGTRYLVTRWTTSLRRMALAYARGDYSAKLDLQRAPSELRDLGNSLMLMAHRIQDREHDLRDSVDQKDMLLREVHHRVKNNLQIITSLLNIHDKQIQNNDPHKVINDIRMRVRALALVHRYLYEGSDVRLMNLKPFLTELAQMLVNSLSSPDRRISLNLDIPDVPVQAERGVSIGLLVTEAITNSLKHAFPDNRPGRITLQVIRKGPTSATLVIADDGVGMQGKQPPEDQPTPTNLGTQLIHGFASQLGTEISVLEDSGTRIELDLNLAPSGSEEPGLVPAQ
jgi:two-component sensor histidine kinase